MTRTFTTEFDIWTDPETLTIKIGEHYFGTPDLWQRPETDFTIKTTICGPAGTDRIGEMHKYYGRRLGPKFNRRFHAANYWLWLGNRFATVTANMLRRGGRVGWYRYHEGLVERANRDAYPYIKEAERDGLHNLIPAIVVFGKSPSAIRAQIGPAAWRRVAHNSRTRNALIMQAVGRDMSRMWVLDVPAAEQDWPTRFVRFMDYPSSILHKAFYGNAIEMTAARVCERKTPIAFEESLHIILDAARMGVEINPLWGLARIRREHDEAVKRDRSKKYSAVTFAKPWQFEKDGFAATLLTTPLDVAVEGGTMHHCVASYARYAQAGTYAVLKIEGSERATLGLEIHGNGWKLDQVYGVCNAPVSDLCRLFALKVASNFRIEAERKAA